MLPWNVEDLTFDETHFSGVVRLFPLADFVMFPHVMQPLHIFEPRYRALLGEALDSDGLIAMSVPAPGQKPGLQRPKLLSHVCLGKVVSHHRLDDGRYNVMLLGVKRCRIVRELPQDRLFRRAEVELLEDCYSFDDAAARADLQERIARQFERSLPLPPGASIDENVRKMLSSEVPLGILTDLVGFALPLSAELKHRLLGENDADRRAVLLVEALKELQAVAPEAGEAAAAPPAPHRTPRPAALAYPPPTSAN
jgi:ATP-dependent Lon protease